jgi:SAM-dependent methyltransferase
MILSDVLLVKETKKCRVCGSKNLVSAISLGNQVVTNFVDNPNKKLYRGPLELVLCGPRGKGCGLLQLRHTFNHDILYKKYWYRSGISAMMVKALADIANKSEKLVKLRKGDIVIDIGSNDGTLLEQFITKGIVKVGFEPSNLWNLAKGKDIVTLHDYFNYKKFAEKFGRKKAKVITAIAMFYDLDDPNAFVEDIKKCLDKDGVFIIQMNYLGLMLKNNTFDNISHEHLEYYSLLSLEYLLRRHGLEVFDVELNDVNGGSFRIYVRQEASKIEGFKGARERVARLRAREINEGLDSISVYKKFERRIEKTRSELLTLLKNENKKRKKIFIYGASTRGLVVLQYAGIDSKLIKAATDKNPNKWGKYIAGTNIPIVSIAEYKRAKPDYLFVLPYHFIDEIKKQNSDFLKNGGKMIVAIPKLRIISKKSV